MQERGLRAGPSSNVVIGLELLKRFDADSMISVPVRMIRSISPVPEFHAVDAARNSYEPVDLHLLSTGIRVEKTAIRNSVAPADGPELSSAICG
jgi:hypothetical protein